MNHRQCIALLAASSLNLAGTAPLRASDGDGVEVRSRGRALLQGAQARHLVLLREAQRGAAQERRRAAAGARAPWLQSAPSLRN
jgi:hypothetical protein